MSLLSATLVCIGLAGFSAAAPGDLDLAFHGTGWTSYPLTGPPPPAQVNIGIMTNMLVQSDGKILIIGRTSPDLLMAMYRFLPNGSPDITFNGSGAVFAPPEFASDNGVNGVLQSDGRIVLGAASTAIAATGWGGGGGVGGLVDEPPRVSANAIVPPITAKTPITAMMCMRRFGGSS